MTILTWVFDILAILLSVAAFCLNRKEAKAFKREDDLFGKLCLISVGLAFFKIIEDSITPGLNIEGLKYGAIISGYFYDIFDLGLLFIWILFVDFMIYRSEDHLRIIRPAIFKKLLIITAAETALAVVALYGTGLADNKRNIILSIWVIASYYLLTIIKVILLIISIRDLSDFRKRRKGPVTFRGMPFYIPIFWGWLISLILVYRIDLNPLATGIGLILLYLSLRKERKYIDSETGFFSAEYLTLLAGVDKKRNYEGGFGILADTDDEANIAINILKRSKPEGVDVIRVSKGTFFLVGERRSKNVLEILRRNLDEAAKEAGINLSVSYDLRDEGEDAKALFNRLSADPSGRQDGR